ncbi:MAG: LytR/AlgR family response regulator transcription factor [Acidobacteriota bacterium]
MKIRTLIIDDEPHAREGIRLRLKRFSDIEVIGEAASGADAASAINRLAPDLVFLDIQMPGMNGFEVLTHVTASPMPIVIFVTAFDQYAIRAFEVHALDYLLKPIGEQRFAEALEAAASEMRKRNLEQYASRLRLAVSEYLGGAGTEEPRALQSAPRMLTRLLVRTKDQISLIEAPEIHWIESAGDYVYVHTHQQKHLLRETLQSLEERLDPQQFIRIHRSAIVRLDQIASLKANDHGDYDVLLKCGAHLKMSRTYRAHFEAAAGGPL